MRATPMHVALLRRCPIRSAPASPAASGSCRWRAATRCVSALADDVDHVRLAVGVEVGQRARRRRVVAGSDNEGETIPMHDSERAPGRSAPPIAPSPVRAVACPDRAAPCATAASRRRLHLRAGRRPGGAAAAGRGAEQPARARRFGLGRLQRRHRAQARRRDHARDPASIPTTSTTRCCSSTCSRSGSRSWPRRARSATSPPTSTSASPGSRSWCATRASTRSRCRAATSACTSA